MFRNTALVLMIAVTCGFAEEEPKNTKGTQQTRPTRQAKGDAAFLMAATQSDLTEIKAAQLAQKFSDNASVKKFAQHMLADHQAMSKKVTLVAGKKGVKLGKELDQKHAAKIEALSQAKGEEFDRLYTKDMVKGHEEAVANFQEEIKSGQDEDVKSLAEMGLPIIQGHLKMAKELVAEVNGSK